MKNITVTVDDVTYRRARMRAAALDTSVSAEVKRFLVDFATTETEFERLLKLEQKVRAEILASGGFSASERLSRDDIHDRAKMRNQG
jgi:plasmid stability protein